VKASQQSVEATGRIRERPRPEDHPVHFVVGAAGGIGSALCLALAESGAQLVLAGRRVEPLEQLAQQLGARSMVLDATDPAAMDAAVAAAVAEFGRLDGLVNLAGSILLKPAHRTSPEEFQETLAQNLTTAFNCVRAGANAMLRTGGSIVLLSTAAARTGLANHEAIAAAKGGVIGLTLSAAASYAPRGIRVNTVAPGLVDTPMAAPILQNEASAKASTAMHALGRLGRPDDVARAIQWLLDPVNDWVTGQVLGVDGGLGTVRGR
jgi:3-oxoacyl-[acyl-carrier protein] reductase